MKKKRTKKSAKRMLILSVKAGAGHLRAAQALAEACEKNHPEIEVRHINALEHTNAVFRNAFSEGYEILTRNLPSVWGMIYENMETRESKERLNKIRNMFSKMNGIALRKVVKDYDPDWIVCTHYMPAKALGQARLDGKLSAPLGVVMTDYDFHVLWIQKGTDIYFVSSEEMAFALGSRAGPSVQIKITGIPVLEAFQKQYPPGPELKSALGFKPDLPLLLVLAGGFGLIPVDKFVGVMAEKLKGVQILVISGSHERLKKKVDKISQIYPDQIYSYGFVHTIHEFMAAADIVITKSGGLTSSECLVMGLPMVITKPIPGHEERNATFILENGAGIWVSTADYLVYKVQQLLTKPERIEKMQQAAKRIAKPNAARDIIDAMIHWETGCGK